MRNPLTTLRKRLLRLRNQPLLAQRHGCQFMLDPRNWIDNRLLANAPYEDAQLAAARATIAHRDIDLVVDIGANIGLYSVVLGKLPAIRNIVAFEPVSRNAFQLGWNLLLNGLSRRAVVHHAAVGDTTSRAEIHIDPRSTGLARLDRASAERDTAVFTERENVAVVRFDDVAPFEGRRAFAKIDVEGHAAEVLRGMGHFLARNAVALQVELSERERAPCRSLLAAAGYRETGNIGSDYLFEPVAWAA